MMKKKLSLLLAVLMLSSSFSACSNNNTEDTSGGNETNDPAGVENTEEEENTINDDLPEVNYDGYTYTVYNTNPDTNVWHTTTHIDFEEDIADTIPSAIYKRNRLVESRFGITMEEVVIEASALKTHLQGGGDGVDLTLLDGTDVISLAQQGMLYDLNTLNYLDFEKPYWDQNSREYLTISGKYFEAVGNMMTTHIDETVCMYFNKQLVDEYALEDPYTLVDEYKWTYDKLYELGVKVLDDTNGDSIRNDLDQYALISWTGVLYPYLIYGSGESYIGKDESDVPYSAFYNERFLAVYEKILGICHSEGDTFTYDANVISDTKGLGHRVQEVMFPNNQALFWIECVSWARALREMEADFGILTAPMYTEDQGKYYNFCNGNFYGQCLPLTLAGEELDRACIIMEGLNSMSDDVLAAYYDISLQGRNVRDEKSGRMLDVIFANRVYDVSIVFDVGSINSGITALAAENKTDLASYNRSNTKVMKKVIEQLVKALEDIDG